MKILYVADYQGPDLLKKRQITNNRHSGGTAKIARLAEALRDCGASLQIASSGTIGKRRVQCEPAFDGQVEGSEIPVWYAPTIDLPGLNRFVYWRALKKWAAKRGPWDLIIIYNFGYAQVRFALHMAQKYGTPVVVEYEDAATLSRYGRSHLAMRRGLKRIGQLKRYLNGAIVVCRELGEQLDLPRTLVLEGIIKGTDVSPAPVERKQFRLLYAGGLTSLKGVDLLLEAMQHVSAPCELDIYGEGPLRDHLVALTKNISRHQITIHGEVEESRLHAAYRNADIFINPHRTTLGHKGGIFPFKIVEYLSNYKPVVSSCIAEVPDELEPAVVFYNGDDAAALGQTISSALSNLDALAVKAVEVGSYVNREYSIAAVSKKLRPFLRNVLRHEIAESV